MEFLPAMAHGVLKEIAISKCLDLLSLLSHQTWLIPLLAILLVRARAALKHQNGLREKLCIEGKPYHDIILDLLYFFRNKPLNKCRIDALEWDFICTFHPENQDFLDIKEQWTIHFSAKTCAVSTLKFGIHGGNPNDLRQETVTADQDGSPLNLPKPLVITGKDCESIDFPLNSDVKRGESSKVTVSFVWQKFIIVNRKDDYFYFLPKSLANEVDEFHFKVKHPYNCEPVVYLLKRTWTSNYIKSQITDKNESKYKSSSKKQGPMEFEFIIKGLGALDVILIIFNRSNDPHP